MKLLTKNTDYAIRALLVLSQHNNDFISAKQISDEQDIPYEYLRKILQQLMKEGLVLSKGRGQGGFKINKDSRKIKVTDVINIFQGDIQFSECMFRKKFCANREHCVLRKNIQRIEKIVVDEFKGITIQSLLKDMEKEG